MNLLTFRIRIGKSEDDVRAESADEAVRFWLSLHHDGATAQAIGPNTWRVSFSDGTAALARARKAVSL